MLCMVSRTGSAGITTPLAAMVTLVTGSAWTRGPRSSPRRRPATDMRSPLRARSIGQCTAPAPERGLHEIDRFGIERSVFGRQSVGNSGRPNHGAEYGRRSASRLSDLHGRPRAVNFLLTTTLGPARHVPPLSVGAAVL